MNRVDYAEFSLFGNKDDSDDWEETLLSKVDLNENSDRQPEDDDRKVDWSDKDVKM